MAEKKELIQANKDSSVWIKKCDAHVFHVRCHRATVIPSNPLTPVWNSWLQTFDQQTWQKFQKLKEGRNPVDWTKAALVNRYEIVHDPTLTKSTGYGK